MCMIPLFSQKHTKEDMLAFSLLAKNEIMLTRKNGRGMILFHLRGKFSHHRHTNSHVVSRNSTFVMTLLHVS